MNFPQTPIFLFFVYWYRTDNLHQIVKNERWGSNMYV